MYGARFARHCRLELTFGGTDVVLVPQTVQSGALSRPTYNAPVPHALEAWTNFYVIVEPKRHEREHHR